MRRNSFRRNTTKNTAYQAYPMVVGNVDWDYTKINQLWRMATGDQFKVLRVLSINADSLAAFEGQPDAYLKRLNIDLTLMANISKARVDGTLTDYTQAVRDDIPFPSGFPDTNGYTGFLLSGKPDDGARDGASSVAEGLPVMMSLIYETYEESGTDITNEQQAFVTNANTRNAKMFWNRVYTPTLYRPERVHLAKAFPGRGVRLSKAAREIYQVSLCACGFDAMGTVVFPSMSFAIANAKAWYRPN